MQVHRGLPVQNTANDYSPVASLQGEGADRPGWHTPGGDTRMKKEIFVAEFTKDKRGRTGKKGPGWHPPGGWHSSKNNKRDSDEQKRSSVFLRRK